MAASVMIISQFETEIDDWKKILAFIQVEKHPS